jgi:hypothetical protein
VGIVNNVQSLTGTTGYVPATLLESGSVINGVKKIMNITIIYPCLRMMNEISEAELDALTDFSWLRLPPLDAPTASENSSPPDQHASPDRPNTSAVIEIGDEEDEVMMAIDDYLNDRVEPVVLPPPQAEPPLAVVPDVLEVLPVPPPAAPTEPTAASFTAQPTALSSPPTTKIR